MILSDVQRERLVLHDQGLILLDFQRGRVDPHIIDRRKIIARRCYLKHCEKRRQYQKDYYAKNRIRVRERQNRVNALKRLNKKKAVK